MIKFFVLDVDGTLTDGRINISSNGEIFKSFSVKDGYGVRFLLKKKGIESIVLTARYSEIVEKRCKEMAVDYVFQNSLDKYKTLQKFIHDYNEKHNSSIGLSNFAYAGDDILDLKCIKKINEFGGLTFCPADACDEIKKECTYISKYNGGNGAVRDFCTILTFESHDSVDIHTKIETYIEYLKKPDIQKLAEGHYDVNDEFSFSILSYQTKNQEDCFFESHPNHIDIQILLFGTEKLLIKNRLYFHNVIRRDQKVDTLFYEEDPSNSSLCILSPGSALVLYPDDCHMGAIENREPCLKKKIVGKLKIK